MIEVCNHGNLRRQCEICHRDAEIIRLVGENEELRNATIEECARECERIGSEMESIKEEPLLGPLVGAFWTDAARNLRNLMAPKKVDCG